METTEILNEKKLLLDQFIDTASEEDLQKVLQIINYLRRPEPEELEADDEERRAKLHTQLLNRIGDFNRNLAEKRIKKTLLNKFIDTASKKDLEEVLKFVSHLRVNNNIEERNSSNTWEQEELEESRMLQIDTSIDVQWILNSLNDFELSEIENKIRFNLQKENTSKEAFDTLKE